MYLTNKDIFKTKLLILGAGESGCGAALLAQQKGYSVFVSDKSKIKSFYREQLVKNKISFEEGKHQKVYQSDWDLIIKSPGIPPFIPILKSAKQKGIPIIDEIEFTFAFCTGKIIAITGTNGKTTTTRLIYHILKSVGKKVGICGNIGKSFALTLLKNPSLDYYILEASSFQLENTIHFKPYIAILLNISPDHLDRYDDINGYIKAKMKVAQNINNLDTFIYNQDDLYIAKAVEKDNLNYSIPFSTQYFQRKLKIYFNKQTFIVDSLPLVGRHNALNLTAAILTNLKLGIRLFEIKKALKTFKNIAHRLEVVRTIKGISFINDSKATNIDAVYYALEAYKNIIWLVGGVDKGNDYNLLKKYIVEHVKCIICLGKNNKLLMQKLFIFQKPIFDTKTIEKAIFVAYKQGCKGDTVLLSPACSSFDLFQNYQHRGDAFKKVVLDLKN